MYRAIQFGLGSYSTYSSYESGWNEIDIQRYVYSGFLFAESGATMFALLD